MNVSRFQIGWLMGIIAIVAINLGAVRVWSASAGPSSGEGFSRLTNQGLVLGGVPMANLLAVGFLVGRRHFASRPFQATALVHEAYLRLVDVESAQSWSNRGHWAYARAWLLRSLDGDRAHE